MKKMSILVVSAMMFLVVGCSKDLEVTVKDNLEVGYGDKLDHSLLFDKDNSDEGITVKEVKNFDAKKTGEQEITVIFTNEDEKTKETFVFVIDEWDAVFHMPFISKDKQQEYLTFLKNLLKDQVYAKLTYMTGVLPIAKYSSGSELNMFVEYDMCVMEKFSNFLVLRRERLTISLMFILRQQKGQRLHGRI